jgi:hypothetical protein
MVMVSCVMVYVACVLPCAQRVTLLLVLSMRQPLSRVTLRSLPSVPFVYVMVSPSITVLNVVPAVQPCWPMPCIHTRIPLLVIVSGVVFILI